jgi:hypothetical protein
MLTEARTTNERDEKVEGAVVSDTTFNGGKHIYGYEVSQAVLARPSDEGRLKRI